MQRLGYLADLFSTPMGGDTRRRLLDGTGNSTCYLGQPGRWGRGGAYCATWRVVDNVPRRELLGDVEVLCSPAHYSAKAVVDDYSSAPWITSYPCNWPITSRRSTTW